MALSPFLKDALHRAVRAKSGEVNKTKPTVPPYLLLGFFFPSLPTSSFFFIIMIFFPSVLSSSQHPWASSVIRTRTNNCFLSDLFGSGNKTKTERKKTHLITSTAHEYIDIAVKTLLCLCLCLRAAAGRGSEDEIIKQRPKKGEEKPAEGGSRLFLCCLFFATLELL